VFSYRVSGLAVASEVELPGLIPGDPGHAPDVTIRRGDVPQQLDRVLAEGPTWQRGEHLFLLRVPGIGRFLLDHGRAIDFAAEDGAGPQDVAVFLTGSVFGVLLHQRNHIVLHASAVLAGGKAMLFCGPSGAGKSTLAAALGEAGYPLIADDQCAVGFGDGAPHVHPDGRQLRLWEHSISALGLGERQGDSMRNRLRKFYVDPVATRDTAVPVGAVYMLEEVREPGIPGIEPLNLADAARSLTANAYRPLLVRKLGQQAVYFQGGAAIAAHAGIFALKRRFDFVDLPATVAMLTAHWRAPGRADAAA